MLNLNYYYETIIATIYRIYHFYVILVLVEMLHACILLQFDHCLIINNNVYSVEIKNLIKNLLSLNCQEVPHNTRACFAKSRFLHAGFYCIVNFFKEFCKQTLNACN